VHAIIHWLTGYDEQTLQQQIDKKVDFETFFARAPPINPNVSKITGVICGYRVEEIEDKLLQRIRYLDKLVDELEPPDPDRERATHVPSGTGESARCCDACCCMR
jgi:hypothetical protein